MWGCGGIETLLNLRRSDSRSGYLENRALRSAKSEGFVFFGTVVYYSTLPMDAKNAPADRWLDGGAISARASKVHVATGLGSWVVERTLVLENLGHTFLQSWLDLDRHRFAQTLRPKSNGEPHQAHFRRLRPRSRRGHPFFCDSPSFTGNESGRVDGA